MSPHAPKAIFCITLFLQQKFQWQDIIFSDYIKANERVNKQFLAKQVFVISTFQPNRAFFSFGNVNWKEKLYANIFVSRNGVRIFNIGRVEPTGM